MYPGPDSNRHSHFWPRDFKSLASTYFATWAYTVSNHYFVVNRSRLLISQLSVQNGIRAPTVPRFGIRSKPLVYTYYILKYKYVFA